MPTLVDKSLVTKVCVDDFALRKRYTYGTVMVDLETHRIIDILDSRETKRVEEWLRTFPNLQVISRDGAQAYASASSNAHPNAMQVCDRFHLLKNLSEVVEAYMRKLFPSRIQIPATSSMQTPEMQALFNTANRVERIRFARQKRSEGYTVNDIALLLHSSVTTITKYLSLSEEQIPESKTISRERQHQEELRRKKQAIDEVRKLYAEGCPLEEISRITGHTDPTVKRYLSEDCSLCNGHYDNRLPGKLAPYEAEVIKLRANGVKYTQIHKIISEKGYTGSVASLRMFMQKERCRMKEISKTAHEDVEYIPRKFFCQLIYKKLETIKGLTQEQYEAALKKYPVLGGLYSLLKDFHRILFSQKADELDAWMESANKLKIDELDTYVNGLRSDIKAVKNAIEQKYNNGLAEGSVNKIKLTKRIMYGRNSFQLLRAKLLLNEFYYKIN